MEEIKILLVEDDIDHVDLINWVNHQLSGDLPPTVIPHSMLHMQDY